MPKSKYIITSPGVFESYKLHDDFGHKSYKTYSEAFQAMEENRKKQEDSSSGIYYFRIDKIVITIINNNEKQINPI